MHRSQDGINIGTMNGAELDSLQDVPMSDLSVSLSDKVGQFLDRVGRKLAAKC